jgi:hypothetical protein
MVSDESLYTIASILLFLIPTSLLKVLPLNILNLGSLLRDQVSQKGEIIFFMV